MITYLLKVAKMHSDPKHDDTFYKLEDVPCYDPLWGYNAMERYCYVSFAYDLRERYVPALYKDSEQTQHITSNLPRLAIDLPYLKKHVAERLNFSHESIWGIRLHSWTINTEK